MALTLDTGHPLYSYIVACICVDDDNTVKDLTGNNTCTPNGSVTLSSGTYGRHFATSRSGGDALGVALSPGFVTKPTANPVGTTFVVINSGVECWGRTPVFNPAGGAQMPCVNEGSGEAPAALNSTEGVGLTGTTDIIGTGAHSFGLAVNGTSSHKVFCDGTVENTSATSLGTASDSTTVTYIGGSNSGGYGAFKAQYVWVVHFRKHLTDQEISDLHDSLGASNAFALVNSGSSNTASLSGKLQRSILLNGLVR